MSKPTKIPRTVLLPEEVWKQLNDLAESSLRKQNSQIEYLIRQAIQQQPEDRRERV